MVARKVCVTQLNNQLPYYLVNFLGDALGEALVDYEEGVQYEESPGILKLRSSVIKTVLSQIFFTPLGTASSAPKASPSSMDKGSIIELITEYDESGAIILPSL